MRTSAATHQETVPPDFVGRLRDPALAQWERERVLFVGVRPTKDDLPDGRPPFRSGLAPVQTILERGECWWALRRHVLSYSWLNPLNQDAPDTLAVLDIEDPRRVVIGSWEIDLTGWQAALDAAGKSSALVVPTVAGGGDHRQLRGRRADVRMLGRDTLSFSAHDGAGVQLP